MCGQPPKEREERRPGEPKRKRKFKARSLPAADTGGGVAPPAFKAPPKSSWQDETPSRRQGGGSARTAGGARPLALQNYGSNLGGAQGTDWRALTSKLPVGKNASQKAARQKLFRRFDFNGNGYLSQAEVDKVVGQAIGSEDLFSAKPVIARAFAASKDLGSGKNGDYVEKSEFRLLLVYLRQYFELLARTCTLPRSRFASVLLWQLPYYGSFRYGSFRIWHLHPPQPLRELQRRLLAYVGHARLYKYKV